MNPRVAMRMFNPDGTEDVCGNGLRCVGLWAFGQGWTDGERGFVVDALDGPRAVRLKEIADDGRVAMLTVDMGAPRLESAVDAPLMVEYRDFRATVLDTGSEHFVVFGPPPDEATFQRYSPLIEHHPAFPRRISVMWATQTGRNTFALRIWERGAGETLGCGTGACAVGVAARLQGLTEGVVQVVSKGGALTIDWPGGDASIEMSGLAALVFDGDFPL